jgi:hypothetical protein
VNKLILTVFLILIASPAWAYTFADQWSKTDTAFEAVYAGLTIVDWGQTRDIAKHPQQYSEMNPLLGKHPSLDKVDILIPTGIVAHGIISMALPPKYRRYWQVIFIGIEGVAVLQNYNAGLRIDF